MELACHKTCATVGKGVVGQRPDGCVSVSALQVKFLYIGLTCNSNFIDRLLKQTMYYVYLYK